MAVSVAELPTSTAKAASEATVASPPPTETATEPPAPVLTVNVVAKASKVAETEASAVNEPTGSTQTSGSGSAPSQAREPFRPDRVQADSA